MPHTGFDNLFVVALVALLAPLAVAAMPSLRVPAVVVEIVAGVVLGPDVLGSWTPTWSRPRGDLAGERRRPGRGGGGVGARLPDGGARSAARARFAVRCGRQARPRAARRAGAGGAAVAGQLVGSLAARALPTWKNSTSEPGSASSRSGRAAPNAVFQKEPLRAAHGPM